LGIQVNGKPPRDFIQGQIKALNATLGQDNEHIGITIDRLITKLADHMSDEMYDTVANIRVPWTEVLHASVPVKYQTQIIAKKKTQVLVPNLPLNPKKSAFLSNSEKSAMGRIKGDPFRSFEQVPDKWKKFTNPETHTKFSEVQLELRGLVQQMSSAAQSTGRLLGHRKPVMENALKQKGVRQAELKKKNAPQLCADFFRLKNLSELNHLAKKVFCPLYYLGEAHSGNRAFYDMIQANLNQPEDVERLILSAPPEQKELGSLYSFWFKIFKPTAADFKGAKSTITVDLATINPFQALTLDEEGPEIKNM
jgi:hypothetical protein